MVRQVIEGTILLIILFLVLSNSAAFTSIIKAGGGVYNTSVRTLQGR